jgi:hypothetical protein
VSNASTDGAFTWPHGSPIPFASFFAYNAAALHLLELVQASSPRAGLEFANIVDDESNTTDAETLAYILSVSGDYRWRVGAGPSTSMTSKISSSCKVDFLLSPPGDSLGAKKARQFIDTNHAVLYFHPKSGMLMLRNTRSKPIIYRHGQVTGEDLELVRGSCVLFRERNYLRFGEYEFVVAFNLDKRQHAKFKIHRDYVTFLHNENAYGNYTRPSRHLALVPAQKHYTLGSVRIHNKLLKGLHSDLYSGVHLHTGQPVAVKKMRYTATTMSWFQREIQAADTFRGSCEHVLGMLDRWRMHNGTACKVSCEAPEHQDEYYSLPLAEYDFETMPWTKIKFPGRLGYMYQTLIGLGKLHEKKITHGRIRPRCLMIVSGYESAAGASESRTPFVLPTGAAISLSVSTYSRDKPPPGYWVAPEVWTSTDDFSCTEKADTWCQNGGTTGGPSAHII